MRLVMLCPTLTDLGGHEYDYTKEVADVAQKSGASVDVFVPSDSEDFSNLPGFCYKTLPPYGYPHSLPGRLGVSLKRFVRYCQIFSSINDDDEIIWFVHSAPQNELAVLICAWMIAGRAGRKLHLFLRQNIGQTFAKTVLTRLLSLASKHRVQFVSDSDSLIDDLSARLKCPITLLPIPVNLPRNIKHDSSHIICGYFGARRKVKGFALLPLLTEVARTGIPGVQFVIQAYAHSADVPETDIENALKALRRQKDIRLIESALTTDMFAQELAACDIILIPYDAANYKDATSGIFVMAVSTGAIVVVTEHTWMARQARKLNLNRVITLPPNPTKSHIAAAMQDTLRKCQNAAPPPISEQQWCENQSAENLWKILRAL